MNKIKIKRSSTANKKPTGLLPGELAVNLQDKKLYAGTEQGDVVQIANPEHADTLAVDGALSAGGKLTASAGADVTNTVNVSGSAAKVEIGSGDSASPEISMHVNPTKIHSIKANGDDLELIAPRVKIADGVLSLNPASGGEIQGKQGNKILSDDGQGNVTVSGSRTGTTAGDLVLGGKVTGHNTRNVQLASDLVNLMNEILVDATTGKIRSSMLDATFITPGGVAGSYYNKTETDTKFQSKTEDAARNYSKTETDTLFAGYYKKQEGDSRYLMRNEIGGNGVYTQEQSDAKFLAKTVAENTYFKKTGGDISGDVSIHQKLNLTNPTAGIEIGSTSQAGLGYIDFHTSGTSVDFDARIIAQGTTLAFDVPNVSISQGSLTLRTNGNSNIHGNLGTPFITDHGNGHITLSASKSADGSVGDLYLGYDDGGTRQTNVVRLLKPLLSPSGTEIINAAGVVRRDALDTTFYSAAESDDRYLYKWGGAIGGGLSFDGKGYGTYESTSLVGWPNDASTAGGVNHLRKMRGYAAGTIFHELVDQKNNEIAWYQGTGPEVKIVSWNAGGDLKANGSITALNGSFFTRAFNAESNSHYWFHGEAGQERAVIYAGANGQLRLRNQASGQGEMILDGGMIHSTAWVSGSDRALIRGTVDGGSHVAWRDRSSGLQLDCPDSDNSAYNVWKATKWNYNHLAAMDVHAAGGNMDGVTVRLVTGNHVHTWNGPNYTSPGTINASSINSSGSLFAASHVYSGNGQSYLRDDGQIGGPIWQGGLATTHIYNVANERANAWAVQEANRVRGEAVSQAVNQCVTAVRLTEHTEGGGIGGGAADVPAGFVVVGLNSSNGQQNASIRLRYKRLQVHIPNNGWMNIEQYWGG